MELSVLGARRADRYVYAGYPLLLALIRAWALAARSRPPTRSPPVTLHRLGLQRGRGHRREDREQPGARLSGATASKSWSSPMLPTTAPTRSWSAYAIRACSLLRMTERGGKTLGLNAAVRSARGEIAGVLRRQRDVPARRVRKLVRNFADPRGRRGRGRIDVRRSGQAARRQKRSAVLALRDRRSSGSKRSSARPSAATARSTRSAERCIGHARGCALRFRQSAADRAERASLHLRAARRVCVEKAAGDFEREFRRKVRIVNRAWRAMCTMQGAAQSAALRLVLAAAAVSHKLLRWLVPLFLRRLPAP